MGDDGAPGPEDILKILVTSDNHIGYNEKDEVRGTDSFESFEEVLKIAADEKVRTMLALALAPARRRAAPLTAQRAQADFILNGGDLFHDNKPSRRTLVRLPPALRRCAAAAEPSSRRGAVQDHRAAAQVLPERSRGVGGGAERPGGELPQQVPHRQLRGPERKPRHFPAAFPRFCAQLYDSALLSPPVLTKFLGQFNVGLPFFIIHGNHDDPTGSGALPGESHLSALDILSARPSPSPPTPARFFQRELSQGVAVVQGANLINYFGKTNDIKDIEIAPILMRKGVTKLALYGLGEPPRTFR